METFNAVYKILEPLILAIVSIVGPIIVAWLSTLLARFLKVKNEQKELEIEGQLRDALHKSIENGISFGASRLGIPTAMIPILIKQAATVSKDGTGTTLQAANATLESLVSIAVNDYVTSKNPDTIEKLNISKDAIRDIVLAKLQKLDEKQPGS